MLFCAFLLNILHLFFKVCFPQLEEPLQVCFFCNHLSSHMFPCSLLGEVSAFPLVEFCPRCVDVFWYVFLAACFSKVICLRSHSGFMIFSNLALLRLQSPVNKADLSRPLVWHSLYFLEWCPECFIQTDLKCSLLDIFPLPFCWYVTTFPQSDFALEYVFRGLQTACWAPAMFCPSRPTADSLSAFRRWPSLFGITIASMWTLECVKTKWSSYVAVPPAFLLPFLGSAPSHLCCFSWWPVVTSICVFIHTPYALVSLLTFDCFGSQISQ